MTLDRASTVRFDDRIDAGEQLAETLAARGVDPDLVLAIPRGGLPLGRAVADALDTPLDIVVASKIGAPRNPEFAIGAVGSDGGVWLDDDAIEQFDIDDAYIEQERAREADYAREKAERYRGSPTPPNLDGKVVVVVDDGTATGSTATAALRLVQDAGADRVVLALPVGPPETVESLRTEADEVICLRTPEHFGAVGQFYARFEQVSDEAAMTYLDNEATE